MVLFILSYLAGMLTILSPCILPVLPFVFARAGLPFVRSGLPLLAGMAVTFAGVASLAAVGGGWAVEANQYGRTAALALVGLFGLTLLFPGLADRLARPLVALGARLSNQAESQEARSGSSVLPSFLLGIATGLLWAPCAGPILGLILTGAALQGASVGTSLLLLSYAAGAATSLALALLLGGRVLRTLKRSLPVGDWVRRGLGAAVLAGAVAIALGLDTGMLTKASLASTTSFEQTLLDRLSPTPNPTPAAPTPSGTPATADMLGVEGPMPSLSGAVAWLNSPPLTSESLRGKVVLVDFWTYSCINCLRSIPYVRAWAEKYKSAGLVVIGVHAPEFAFEKDQDNVRRALKDLQIGYPVALDNDYNIWRAFDNHYWPAHYFIDAQGRIRYHHFGEGAYEHSEEVIRQLLAEAGHREALGNAAKETALVQTVAASGVQAEADVKDIGSPETYIGYARAENFASPGGAVRDAGHGYGGYGPGVQPRLNDWGLEGTWTVEAERAVLNRAGGRILYRFHARDLHLVLGPGQDGKPVRFRVILDGAPPGDDHGVDTDAAGKGIVTQQRLYQLVRQSKGVRDRTFEIEFLDPGVQAFAFTFG